MRRPNMAIVRARAYVQSFLFIKATTDRGSRLNMSTFPFELCTLRETYSAGIADQPTF
jgi:hypothetical protein